MKLKPKEFSHARSLFICCLLVMVFGFVYEKIQKLITPQCRVYNVTFTVKVPTDKAFDVSKLQLQTASYFNIESTQVQITLIK